MIDFYSEEDAIATVARLTHTQLLSFVKARIVTPMQSESGPVYRQIDLVRMELLCELSEQFELDDDALGVVISLIDQLHGVRAELRAFVDAIASEPADVRERISEAVRATRSTG
ncbi:hypothetical protein ACFFUT_15710 [Pseudohalocynthiibacter aestuariivivens]|uniref:MerR family transcriptional regulator n=1 Tax=Pseudohalocynthiibacter aestuariivivens TaxID=1591409 RepID=A0ABV5JIE1_9RHOB|nr:hypothetical protein [Pseudohalocynthiibacter aestuariivivens]MBS9716467.1 hypothetical protein [Pseudohalocynthiibacter aestuariivivens]